jgi:hypothetical protein
MVCTAELIHYESDGQEITAFREKEVSQSSSQVFYSGPAESASQLHSTRPTSTLQLHKTQKSNSRLLG